MIVRYGLIVLLGLSTLRAQPLQGEQVEGVSNDDQGKLTQDDTPTFVPLQISNMPLRVYRESDSTTSEQQPVQHVVEPDPQTDGKLIPSGVMPEQIITQYQDAISDQVDESSNQERNKRHLHWKKWGGGGWGGGGGGWGGKSYGGGYGGGGWGGGGHGGGGWGGGGSLQISKVVVVPIKVVSGGGWGGHGGYGGGGYGGWKGGGYGGGHGGYGGGGHGGYGGGGHGGGGQGGWGGSGCGGGCGGGGGGGSYSWSHASASSGSGSWGKKK